jgi:hypothetical protein
MIITDSTGKEYNIKGKIKISFPEWRNNSADLTLKPIQLANMIETFMGEHATDSGCFVRDKLSESLH